MRFVRSRAVSRLARASVGIIISLVCVAIFAGSFSPDVILSRLGEVLSRLSVVNPLFLLPAIALYFLGTWARAVRWQGLLPGGLPVPLLFRTLIIGLTVNDLLPGRIGEVARVFLLARHASVPVGVSLASIVVERVLDGIALTALLGTAILLSGDGRLVQLAILSSTIFAVAAGGLVWAALVPRPARWLGYRVADFTPPALAERLKRVVDGVLEGLRTVTHPAVAARVIGLSLLAWAFEASMYVVIMTAFQLPGGIAAGAMGTSAANLATLVPSGPGYAGTFDVALQSVLVGVFGAAEAEARSYTVTVHALVIVPVVIVGLTFMWRENLSLPDLLRRPHYTRNEELRALS